MKERPILYSAPMVRAKLAGTKTETRRIVRPQPEEHHWKGLLGYELRASFHPTTRKGGGEVVAAVRFSHRIAANPHDDGVLWVACPYGQVGDRLWGRETFARHPEVAGEFIYRANRGGDYQGAAQGDFKWKPSIHMPREASRILDELVGIRVERLQDITEAGANAEGCDMVPGLTAVGAYSQLWESIHGPGAWARNDWVWVLTTRPVKNP